MANEFVPRREGEVIENAVTLLLPSGQIFEGWEDMQITKSLESIANTFSFRFDDKFQVTNEKWPFKPSDLVRINIGEERVITGRIDQMSVGFSAGSRNVSVTGRSLAGDLIDCSVSEPYEYANLNVISIAEQLTAAFGIKVFTSVESKIIEKFALKPGETVYTALDRAARLQGFFWVSTRAGNIRLTKISRARADTELHQDVNMKTGSIQFNESERFSIYKVIGNRSGTEEFFGKSSSEPIGSAIDEGVKRFRPMTVVAESSIDSDQATDRAQWEAAVRLAKGLEVEGSVQGWRQETGNLWGVNQLTRLRSKFLGVDTDFLITQVVHTKSNTGGTVSSISLRHENAFQPVPVIPKSDALDDLLGPGGVK